MTTNAIPFQTSKFQDGSVAGTSFTDVGEVVDITGPTMKLDQVDASHAQSSFKEYVDGLFDYGDVVVAMNYLAGDTNGQDVLKTAFDAKTTHYFRVLLGTSPEEKYTFQGKIIGWDVSGKVDSKWDLRITIRIKSAPTQ